jgi:hypothetical protein
MSENHVPEIAIFFMTVPMKCTTSKELKRQPKPGRIHKFVATGADNKIPVWPVRFGPASAMPPIRTKQSQNVGSSIMKQERKKGRNNERLKEDAPLGVSKIKSALRQTRRLLAKVQ